MIYVLIVIGYMGGHVNGATTAMQEFNSAAACEDARKEILAQAAEWRLGDRLRPLCIPKGQRGVVG